MIVLHGAGVVKGRGMPVLKLEEFGVSILVPEVWIFNL
jgi:hypothetical protein